MIGSTQQHSAKQPVPSGISALPTNVITGPVTFRHARPVDRSCVPGPPWAHLPKPAPTRHGGQPGLVTRKDSSLQNLTPLPHSIPLKSTNLRAQAQKKHSLPSPGNRPPAPTYTSRSPCGRTQLCQCKLSVREQRLKLLAQQMDLSGADAGG